MASRAQLKRQLRAPIVVGVAMAAFQAIAVHGFLHEWFSGVNLLTGGLLLLTIPGDVAIMVFTMSAHAIPSAWGFAASIVINGLAGFLLVFLWTEDEGSSNPEPPGR